jgi:hypothetical protein
VSQKVVPYGLGTKEQFAVLQAQSWAANTQLQWELPSSGYVARVQIAINGTVSVTAGTAGNGNLYALIQRYALNVTYGFEYRGFDGDSLDFWNQVQVQGANDPILNSPLYHSWSSNTNGTQTVNVVYDDYVQMNPGIDFDMFLIPYQNFSKKMYLVINCGNISDTYGTTETLANVTLTVTPTIVYQTVPADTADVSYAEPDTGALTQVLDEKKLVGQVIAGKNTVNLTPINGPEYLGLGFKLRLNGAFDPTSYLSNLQYVRLLANSTVQVDYLSLNTITQRMFKHFGRQLPRAWYYLPFSDDISLVNAIGPMERNVFSTQEYTQLDMEVNIASGATVGSDNYIKLWKRLKAEAIAA